MSRITMWIGISALAAVLLIGGTVWFLRSRGENVNTFISNVRQVIAPQAQNQVRYDKPSRFIVASTTRKMVLPEVSSTIPIDSMQLPATLTQ